MNKHILIFCMILTGCTSSLAESVELLPDKNVGQINAIDRDENCFADNNFVNKSKNLASGQIMYLYQDSLVRGTLGDADLYASEHISIYLGEIVLINDKIEFRPYTGNNSKYDFIQLAYGIDVLKQKTLEDLSMDRKKIQNKISEYILKTNSSKVVDVTSIVVTTRFNEQKGKLFEEIKQGTPKCIVSIEKNDFLRALDISLIERYSVTISVDRRTNAGK